MSGSGRSSGGGGSRQPQQQQGGSRRRHREREHQPSGRRVESSINLDELRELADLITAQGFTEFELEREGFRLRLSRNTYPPPPTGVGTGAQASALPAPQSTMTATGSGSGQVTPSTPPAVPVAETAGSTAASSSGDELHKITSPIVGTFYRAPSPTSEVFVNQGSRVEAETVVCIIEAMKLMNEIQAEVSGTIEKIYVENGQPVEYGQPLFGVKK